MMNIGSDTRAQFSGTAFALCLLEPTNEIDYNEEDRMLFTNNPLDRTLQSSSSSSFDTRPNQPLPFTLQQLSQAIHPLPLLTNTNSNNNTDPTVGTGKSQQATTSFDGVQDPLLSTWGLLQGNLNPDLVSGAALSSGSSCSPPLAVSFNSCLPGSIPLTISRTQQLFAQKMQAEESRDSQGNNNNNQQQQYSASPSSSQLQFPPSATSTLNNDWPSQESFKQFDQLRESATVFNPSFTAGQFTSPKITTFNNKPSNMSQNGSVTAEGGGRDPTIDSATPNTSSSTGQNQMQNQQAAPPGSYTHSDGSNSAVPSSQHSQSQSLPSQNQTQQQSSSSSQQQQQAPPMSVSLPVPASGYRKPTQQSLYFQQLIAAKLGQQNGGQLGSGGGGGGGGPGSQTSPSMNQGGWGPDANELALLPSTHSPMYTVSGGNDQGGNNSGGGGGGGGGGDNSGHNNNNNNGSPYFGSGSFPSHDRGGYPPPPHTAPPGGHFDPYGPPPPQMSYPPYNAWPHSFPGYPHSQPGSAPPEQTGFAAHMGGGGVGSGGGGGGNEMLTEFWGRSVTRPAGGGGGGQGGYPDYSKAWGQQQHQHQQQFPGGRMGGSKPYGPGGSGGGLPGSACSSNLKSGDEIRRPESTGGESSSRAPPGYHSNAFDNNNNNSGNISGEPTIVPDLTSGGPQSTPWSGSLPSQYGDPMGSMSISGDQPKKATLACHFCRGRKLRCDGAKPTCAHCVKRGLACSYDTIIRRRGPGRHKKADKVAAALAATEANGGIVPPEYESLLNPRNKLGGSGSGSGVKGEGKSKRGRKPKIKNEGGGEGSSRGDGMKKEGGAGGGGGNGSEDDDDEGNGSRDDTGDDQSGYYTGQDISSRSYASISGQHHHQQQHHHQNHLPAYQPMGGGGGGPGGSGSSYPYPSPSSYSNHHHQQQQQMHHHQHQQQSYHHHQQHPHLPSPSLPSPSIPTSTWDPAAASAAATAAQAAAAASGSSSASSSFGRLPPIPDSGYYNSQRQGQGPGQGGYGQSSWSGNGSGNGNGNGNGSGNGSDGGRRSLMDSGLDETESERARKRARV